MCLNNGLHAVPFNRVLGPPYYATDSKYILSPNEGGVMGWRGHVAGVWISTLVACTLSRETFASQGVMKGRSNGRDRERLLTAEWASSISGGATPRYESAQKTRGNPWPEPCTGCTRGFYFSGGERRSETTQRTLGTAQYESARSLSTERGATADSITFRSMNRPQITLQVQALWNLQKGLSSGDMKFARRKSVFLSLAHCKNIQEGSQFPRKNPSISCSVSFSNDINVWFYNIL